MDQGTAPAAMTQNQDGVLSMPGEEQAIGIIRMTKPN